MNMQRPLTGAERVARRRAALRAQGLRPRTYWLPDTSTPDFAEKAAHATAAINSEWDESPELRAWIDAMTDEILADIPPPEGLV